MLSLLSVALCINVFGLAFSQYSPPPPQDVTVVKSKLRTNVSISYKEPGLCETTPGVKSYAGYIHLPPGTLSDVQQDQFYDIHQFFWFFESRKDPKNAPLVVWVSGGFGYSALGGLFSGNGPCLVKIDSNSTTVNPWSWNNEVNMLYIDQPNQVGFSYDEVTTGTLDLTTGDLISLDPEDVVPRQNDTFLVGKFSTQDPEATANTTANAARALWLFAQVWFQEFPGYKPKNDKLSIFTEGVGGRLGPSFGAFLEEQNERIKNDTIPNKSADQIINLDTLGIMNGCIDLVSQELSYPEFAYNNTYGIQAINESVYKDTIDNFHRPQTGCLALTLKCRSLADKFDPDAYGYDEEVSAACAEASDYCLAHVESQYDSSRRSLWDVVAPWTNAYSPSFYLGFLSQPWVQAALGVPVNFTQRALGPSDALNWTGAYARKDRRNGELGDIAYLLDKGVKVALIYGDRDYSCNWLGGENVSLAVNHSQATAFRSAGYEDITVNSSYVGGQVRQHGNYSFSRVYEAGASVSASQPETAFQLFQRAIFGLDIAAGKVNTEKAVNYSSKGTPTALQAKPENPRVPQSMCYVLDPLTCSDQEWSEVYYGTGVVHQHVLIDETTADLFPGVIGNKGNQTAGKIAQGDEVDLRDARLNAGEDEEAGGAPDPASNGSIGSVTSLRVGLEVIVLAGVGWALGHWL